MLEAAAGFVSLEPLVPLAADSVTTAGIQKAFVESLDAWLWSETVTPPEPLVHSAVQ